ncbi:hypothetical protein LTR22_027322 [Elasticomyces elasticus]|nr:hypothetical protein LTR22_027322 [Elasticomyces elasticus]
MCNLRPFSRISRLPDREERLLQRIVELNTMLVEKCVAGLLSLDRETRRWLRSAKLSEPDQRPPARLQNASSQQTDEGSNGDDSSAGNTGHAARTSVDVYKDARRLYPWHARQRELLSRVQQSVEAAWEDQVQLKALLAWYESVIFQRVRGDPFTSALLHFLAVLWIDETTFRLRLANDFSYMLDGVVYCTRVLGVEVILPFDARETQADADDERFRQQRDEYLADGTYSVVSKMLSLLAYGKSMALSHNNAGVISWSLDRTVMSYRGRPIKLARLQEMISSVIDEATDKLWAELMWTRFDDRFEMPLEQFQDDVTFTKRSMSFFTNSTNGLQDKRDWMLQHAFAHPKGRKLHSTGRWSKTAVQKYLRQVDRFRELLLLCVHVTGGQPAYGSEITMIRFRNGFLQDRNVFVIQRQMVVVTRYHKSQSQFDKPKVIPRFLRWRVGQLLAVYLTQQTKPTHNVNLSAFIDGKDQPLRVAEVPIPKPGPEDIVVRNRAVAINTIDPAQRAGFQIKQYPAVVGMDLAGDVHEVGSRVSRFKKGDRVIGHNWQFLTVLPEDGAFSLLCRIPAANAADVVLLLAIDTAAGGFYQSVYMGLDFPSSTAEPNSKGEVVVVYGGSSSVGCAAIQLAVNAGYRVFATASPNHFSASIADDIAAAMGKDRFIGLYNAIGIPESFDVVTPIMEKLGGGFLANTKPPGKLPNSSRLSSISASMRPDGRSGRTGLDKSLRVGPSSVCQKRRSLEVGWRAWKRQGFKIMDGDVSGEKIVVEL